MSYSFQNPCYNCKKGNGTPEWGYRNECKDAEKIQYSINQIHMSNDGTHKGSGVILLSCNKVEPLHE